MTYQYHGRLQWLAVLTILMEINQGDIADLPGQGSYAGYVVLECRLWLRMLVLNGVGMYIEINLEH